jgi:hypothetical protein
MASIELTCNLSVLAKCPKTYVIRAICKVSEMPKNARYYDTIYPANPPQTIQNIYRTDAGIFYATEPKI